MKEELKSAISSLNEELLSDVKKFNERLYGNPIGLMAYNRAMESILCLSSSPYESAHKFYDIYSGLFEYAMNLKTENPEYEKEELSENLEKFCIEDETIKSYMTEHLYIPSQENIAMFAHHVIDIYNTLESLGFNEIIAKEKKI